MCDRIIERDCTHTVLSSVASIMMTNSDKIIIVTETLMFHLLAVSMIDSQTKDKIVSH